MITSKGKSILAKYLIGQAPAYASYIAFGCGPRPLSSVDAFGDYSDKTTLDFEMFRAPIVSRGYVTENVLNENGDIEVDSFGNPVQFSQIVFTAELPTDERYEITEVGVYSAGANPAASSNDSKVMYSFTQFEKWEYHQPTSSATLPRYTQPLYLDVNNALPEGASETAINQDDLVFQANSDNVVLDNQIRINRGERSRFLNNIIFMRGDSCSVYGSGDNLYTELNPTNPEYDMRHIHIDSSQLGLEKSSPQDEIRLAFSIVNKDSDSATPSDLKMIIEFSTPEGLASQQYARFGVHLNSVDNDFNNNRYFVASSRLEDMDKSSEFSWTTATNVKIYSSILYDGSFSDNFYLALDAMRLENVSSVTPLYGLTGYTVTKTQSGVPVVKDANTANMLEFRFAMDVQ